MSAGTKKKPTGKNEQVIFGNGNHKRKSDRNRAALRWWIGTVILTLLPTITNVIIAILSNDTQFTWELIFGGGELIISSVLIITSTLISCNNVKKKSALTDIIMYTLFGAGFFQVIAYIVFKTNKTNNLNVVIGVSLVSLLVSTLTSWAWYNLTSEED